MGPHPHGIYQPEENTVQCLAAIQTVLQYIVIDTGWAAHLLQQL